MERDRVNQPKSDNSELPVPASELLQSPTPKSPSFIILLVFKEQVSALLVLDAMKS